METHLMDSEEMEFQQWKYAVDQEHRAFMKWLRTSEPENIQIDTAKQHKKFLVYRKFGNEPKIIKDWDQRPNPHCR
jgi:hypothetical protein